MKSLKLSCSDKQAKYFNMLISEYVKMTYMRLDAQNTGDIHIDKIISESLKDKTEEIGRFILDHQTGGIE